MKTKTTNYNHNKHLKSKKYVQPFKARGRAQSIIENYLSTGLMPLSFTTGL